jgi:putative ABC transport system substrate-binding protein
MNRRESLVALGAGFVTVSLPCLAQSPVTKIARIGVLGAGSAAGLKAMTDAFRAGLRDLGYVEGKNITIEFRWAESKYDRLPGLAAELVHARVDVIVSHSIVGLGTAKRATSFIPIVMAAIGDPVAAGIVPNLSHPGGNITGLSFFSQEIAAKRIELLKEAMPGIKQIGVLVDSETLPAFRASMEIAARGLKVALEFVDVQSADRLEATFAALAKKRIEGIVVRETPMLVSNGNSIGAAAARHRIAAIGFKEVAEGGGLIAYGANLTDMWRRAATFVDKILKGAKPGDLPIEQATKFDLAINLKTAKALGIKIPKSIMLRADKVIE